MIPLTGHITKDNVEIGWERMSSFLVPRMLLHFELIVALTFALRRSCMLLNYWIFMGKGGENCPRLVLFTVTVFPAVFWRSTESFNFKIWKLTARIDVVLTWSQLARFWWKRYRNLHCHLVIELRYQLFLLLGSNRIIYWFCLGSYLVQNLERSQMNLLIWLEKPLFILSV